MIRLSIDNSYSRIEGLTKEQFKHLRIALSYKVNSAAAYFSGSGVYRRYLINARGSFPTGLLHKVVNFLNGTRFILQDRRIAPTIHFKALGACALGVTPYPEQNAAIKAARGLIRGTISACTGFGKSLTMAMLVASKQVKTLIIVPNLGLKEQLTRDFTKYFGSLDNIRIENIDNPALNKLTDFDMLIVDEAHHTAARTYRRLNKVAWNKIYYRYFFTATPFRNNDEEQILMESIAGQIIYEIPYLKARDRGYVVPVEAYFVEIPAIATSGTVYSQVYSELVVTNAARNKIIADLLLGLKEANASTLCLVKEIAHGAELSRLTGIPFAHGENESTSSLIADFNSKALSCLIGTVGVLGEGIDTRPAEYVLIAGLGRAKSQFMQQVGRALRRFPLKYSAKVVIFKDKSHKYTINHFNEQVKILKSEYGATAVRL